MNQFVTIPKKNEIWDTDNNYDLFILKNDVHSRAFGNFENVRLSANNLYTRATFKFYDK